MIIKQDFITKSECARRLGVTPTTISKGIKSGRFKTYSRKGKQFVDYRECKTVYIHTSTRSGDPPKGGGISKKINGKKKLDTSSLTGDLENVSIDKMFNLHDIRIQAERNKALREKIQLEAVLGKYLEFDKVKKEFCSIAENLKKSLLAIPDRVAPIIAAEKDTHIVRQTLVNEIKRSLQGMVNRKLEEYEDKQAVL